MKKMKKMGLVVLSLIFVAVIVAFSVSALNVGTVSSVKTTKTATTISLSWKKAKDAVGYRIYERKDGKWKTVGNTTKTTFKINELKSGTKHTFAIKAYGKEKNKTVWAKEFRTVTTGTRPVTVKTLKASVSDTSAKLTWSKAAGATGYRLYKYNSSKKSWDVILKSTSATTVTVKKLKSGTKYTFAVKPYFKAGSETVWASAHTQLKICTKPAAPSKLTAKAAKNFVALSWNKVTGATGYRLYKYNSSKKSWDVILKSTSSTSVTVKGLKTGTKYIFAVKPYLKFNGKTVWASNYKKITVTTKLDYSKLTIGLICLHDENSVYDKAFLEAFYSASKKLGFNSIWVTNIPESYDCYYAAEALVDRGCDIIISNSFGHEDFMIEAAKKNKNVQFISITGQKAKSEGLSNFHNAYAKTHEGRYLTGVAAGLKLNEWIKNKKISASQAKLGYVGAYPYAEVISDYTAFYLGAKTVCPSVKMEVRFTNSWYDIGKERDVARELIFNNCAIISHHSNSIGTAMACNEYGIPVVPFCNNLKDYYPSTYLITTSINWEPYFTAIAEQFAKGEKIPTDWAGGLKEKAITVSTPNTNVAAKGTKDKITSISKQIANGKIKVFDTSEFTVGGKKINSYKADVIPDYSFTPDTQVIKNGAFLESDAERFRSSPYFDIMIDGITVIY